MDSVQANFSKSERVSKKKEIALLFEQGASFIVYPVRVVFYLAKKEEEDESVAILVNVPKRKFKRAVQRNRIKRLLREVYRQNKQELKNKMDVTETRLLIAFLYLGDDLLPYQKIEEAVNKALTWLPSGKK